MKAPRLPPRVVLEIALKVGEKRGYTIGAVFEESDQNFEFQPQTQLQFDEEYNRRVAESTPPNETATPTPMETPQMTLHHQ